MATGVAVVAAAVGAVVLLRRASLRWGASDDELRMALPGDDLLSDPDLVATRAISIDAGPADVWPWIAQLGQNRGGFYSYDWLENLVGVEISTADRIVPDLQMQAVGDAVDLAPGVALTVAALEAERHLVLRGAVAIDGTGAGAGTGGAGTGAGAPYDFTWAFVLMPRSDGSTRLVVRERYAYLTGWAAALVEPVEMVSFLMTERMLRGIRDRAERTARPAARDRSTSSPSAG
ncbi:SRPBCC family protein [Agromyces bauzanensis]|uniref:SRPBCC family protein n=1 Tax=Agromyces bauzanensis TaxID=1308924 RepID=A0A917PEL7_9MICO|nr:SRPBCC family protein [Agromyces bauzanensis]GGJ73265.1 hypothetical protein GCM10011372_09120 [Agromyces bauzanensis]